MRRSLLAGLVAVQAALLWLPSPAAAVPAPPRDLEVLGGNGWHADPRFQAVWESPSGEPLAAIRYLVRDASGDVVFGPRRDELPVHSVSVDVPSRPGAYTLEVWLEGRDGDQGPPASTLLRFDDARPPAAAPTPHPSWVGRGELPFSIRIGHPQGAAPLSGIRGYAVTVDRDLDGRPCESLHRCGEDETVLRGGIGDDLFAAGELPEGLSYVHVLAVSGSGMASASVGSEPLWVDRTDPVTRLSGLPDGWVNRPVVLRAAATDSASGMRPDGPAGPFTAIRIDDGVPTLAAGSEVSATVISSGVHTVAYFARDAAGNADDGSGPNGRPAHPPRTATVRIDREPPTVRFLPSAHPDEPELIEARVSDSLSGPDPGRGWIGVRAAGSGAAFEPLPTVSAGDRLRARWPSESYPPGNYEFEAVGRDRAGNVAAGRRRLSGAAMVLPSPLKVPTVLSAALGGAGAVRTVRYGRGAAYRGTLTLGSGTPLAGAPLRIVERFVAAAGLPPRVTEAETGPGGHFSVRLAPGPSRTVSARFAGTPDRTAATASPLTLAVRSGVRLSVSARRARVGGRAVLFRGRVAGAALPRGGLPVALEFRLPGLPWSEFRTVGTDARGRFRYAYRFSDDDSRGVRFLFRAHVNANGDWPYEPGSSLPVAVSGY